MIKMTLRLVLIGLSLLLVGCSAPETSSESERPLSRIELQKAYDQSFEELQSAYSQKVGRIACTEFFGGNLDNAARYFRILEAIVPTWEGYADGVLREGAAFEVSLCLP